MSPPEDGFKQDKTYCIIKLQAALILLWYHCVRYLVVDDHFRFFQVGNRFFRFRSNWASNKIAESLVVSIRIVRIGLN
jgi:hypothetical protein